RIARRRASCRISEHESPAPSRLELLRGHQSLAEVVGIDGDVLPGYSDDTHPENEPSVAGAQPIRRAGLTCQIVIDRIDDAFGVRGVVGIGKPVRLDALDVALDGIQHVDAEALFLVEAPEVDVVFGPGVNGIGTIDFAT